MSLIDVNECYTDSPFFRENLAATEEGVSRMESAIKNVVKLMKTTCDKAQGVFYCRYRHAIPVILKNSLLTCCDRVLPLFFKIRRRFGKCCNTRISRR